MNLELINKLISISRDQEKLYHTYFDWDNYDVNPNQWFMDEQIISLYGLPIYDTLSEVQKKQLSKLEVTQIIYTYAQSETIMCNFMARHLLQLKFAEPAFIFLLREQIEEYRHQDMFIRAIDMLGHTYIPITGFLEWQGKISSKILPAKRFFLLQIVVELIAEDFGKLCFSKDHVCKLVQDVSKYHNIEESRHIVFAREYLNKYLSKLHFFDRTFGGIIMALDIYFMNAGYIRKEFYTQVGISDADKWYREAKKAYKRNAVKNFTSPDGLAIIKKYRLITWANARFIKLLTGISLKGGDQK